MNGQEFHAARRALGMSQEALGAALGYTGRQLRTWEKAGAAIDVPPAVALAMRYLAEHPEANAGPKPESPERGR